MAIPINLKQVKKMLMRKSLYDFILEMWDAYETAPLCDHWLIEWMSECYMYSIKHFLPRYVWQDWISDEDYAKLKLETGGVCDVRDKLYQGNHVHNHDWNMPPRHMKSSIINVCGPVWTVLNTPITVASVSHTERLSSEMNIKRKTLISSDKFNYYFGEEQSLALDRSSASSITFRNGAMLYSVCQKAFTGFGADVIVADDLISGDNARKDAGVLRDAIDFFRNTLPTRLNSKVTGVVWQVQQRLAQGDISGNILGDKNLSKVYSHTELRAIPNNPVTLLYPCTGKVKHIAPGELLWAERFGDYSTLLMEVGSSEFDTQFNQDPSSSSLNIIKDTHIHYISEKEFIENYKDTAELHYASHDCPVKGSETSDFHGFCGGYGKGNELIIETGWEKHLGYVDEKQLLINLETVDPSLLQVVEDKANGAALLQDLRGDVSGLVEFQPGTRSKMQRLELASVYMDNGSVRFIEGEGTAYLIDRLKRFPLIEHDDIVDAFSQLVLYHFTARKLGVYAGAFTFKNIIDPIVHEDAKHTFYEYAATIKGDAIKLIATTRNFQTDEFVVEKEWLFHTVEGFTKFCQDNIRSGELVLDASINNILSTIINNVVLVTNFEEKDRDASIQSLRAGFYKKKVLVSKTCGQTISDISRLRVTDNSREQGVDKTETLDEGFAGCLRALVTYNKGYSNIWY